jgi:DNA polymerase IIIc chi subunit
MKFYLQGKGSANDAIFIVNSDDTVSIVAEVGCSNCIDTTTNKLNARGYYKYLRDIGWQKVSSSRRSFQQIQQSIRD